MAIHRALFALVGGWAALSAQMPVQTQPRATLPAKALTAQSRNVDVSTVSGEKTVVRRDAAVRRVDAGTKTTTVRPDEYIVARWAPKATEIAPVVAAPTPKGEGGSPDAAGSPPVGERKTWSIPFGFIGVADDGREIRFRPVIESDGGLLVSKDASGFQGRIFVGLRDNRDPAAAYRLPQPVSLLVRGTAAETAPRQLDIDHTNLPFAEVSVSAMDPPDAIDFTLLAAGTTEQATVSLPVFRPRLELLTARSRIQGLGLETAVVTVRAVGMRSPAGRAVSVTSDFASVEPTEVRLNDQGTAVATVRSVSIGNASLRATSSPLVPGTATIAFAWPIAFFLAAITGGVAGAALARIQKSGLPKKKSLQTVVVRGVLTGLIVVALYAIGVNVLPVQPSATAGEVLAFAVAAVGGFVGLKF